VKQRQVTLAIRRTFSFVCSNSIQTRGLYVAAQQTRNSLMMIASKTEAEWIGLQDARKMISTSRVIMLDLIKTRAVKAAQLRVPGKRWGRWVINRASLEKYLEKQAEKAGE
jgi:hypothetical protein